jgi:hypothetical protein
MKYRLRGEVRSENTEAHAAIAQKAITVGGRGALMFGTFFYLVLDFPESLAGKSIGKSDIHFIINLIFCGRPPCLAEKQAKQEYCYWPFAWR